MTKQVDLFTAEEHLVLARWLRNSIRPSSFMNVEDLGFGPRFFRILPNTFVSLGLFLTFLGLVAALHEFSQSMAASGNGGNMESAMTVFMQIASAKFVMSLVGLLCSILFTILLRSRSGAVDRDLHRLCLRIERRLVFVSLEDIGFRQLKAATEQREHLREIGYGIVAELREPLDAMPEKVASSIVASMEPIFEKVTSMGTSGMEGMVGDLSSQLSQSVGNALNRASESLGEATDRIGMMVDRMNASNAQAGEGLLTALSQMATALSDMRSEITASGQTASEAMNEGAEKLLGVMNETLSGRSALHYGDASEHKRHRHNPRGVPVTVGRVPVRASDDLRERALLNTRELPPLDNMRRSVGRVVQRWPDAVKVPGDRDRERMALEMARRINDWD